MPELPEVEVIVRGLKKNILDSKILDFNILNNKLRFPVDPNMRSLYKNRTIKYIFRRGKYGFIILDGSDHIVFHLGMTGKFRLTTNLKVKKKHDHINIKLSNKLNLIYNDVRKFGFFLKVSNPIDLYNFRNLGVEPNFLQYSKTSLWKSLKKKKKDIKSILLDQSFIAGVGNIYASEILFDSKIHPLKNGIEFDKKSFDQLILSTEKILNKAIEKGGVSIKDYRNIEGELGYFQIDLKVYGREGLSCFKCRNLITKIKGNGRSTFYCGKCQKNEKSQRYNI